MPCRSCHSTNQQLFRSEVAIHPTSLNLPQMLLYPEVLVCLDCGFTQFSIPEQMLHELANLKRTA
jgi:hypothetical protein